MARTKSDIQEQLDELTDSLQPHLHELVDIISALDAGGPSTWRHLQLRDSLEEAVRALITDAYGTDSSEDLFLNSRVRGTTDTYQMLASEIAR